MQLNDPLFPVADPLALTNLLFLQQGDLSTAVDLETIRDFITASIAFESTQISDSTAIGRTILTAADAAAVRTAISAAAASHTHASTDISDSSAVGRSVLTAADADAVRTAIDAAEGTHSHAAAEISDSTAVGQALMTAADEPAARTAISAAAAAHTHPANEVIGVGRSLAVDTGATLVLNDSNGVIVLDPDSTDVNMTIPGISGFAVGDQVQIANIGALEVDFVADTGATFIPASPASVPTESSVTMVCVASSGATQTWLFR